MYVSTHVILVTILALTGSTLALSSTNCTQYGLDECGLGGRCVTGTLASTCLCYQGYVRSSTTSGCVDIDECSYSGARLCVDGRCINMDGTYYCGCGYVSHYPDGKSCRRQHDMGSFGIPNWAWATIFLEARK